MTNSALAQTPHRTDQRRNGLLSSVVNLFRPAPMLMALAIPALVSLGTGTGQAAEQLPYVKVTKIEDTQPGVTRTFFGEIAAKQTVDLGFQVSGRIVELAAVEGTVIPQGTVIAKLDPVPFEIEVDRARLALEQADRTLKRFEKLSQSTVSEAQLLDARTEVELARVNLRNAEYALDQSVLIAPFDAIVAARSVENFSIVSAGTQVLRLHDLSELRVDVEVPEILVQRLGDTPNISLRAMFPGRSDSLPLSFRELNAETSEIGQTFRVTLAMDAPQERLLFPGASVIVAATLNDEDRGIKVPTSAIATDPKGNTSVLKLVETADGLVLGRAPVDLRVAGSGDIEIMSGVAAGDEIVVGGVNALEDGQSVRRFAKKLN